MAGVSGHSVTLSGTSHFTAGSEVVEVTSISLPEIGKTDIDVSSMSDADLYKTFIGGMKDPGVIELEINYNAAQEPLILAAIDDENNQTWTLTLPLGTWASDAYVNKSSGGSAPMDDKITRVLGLKCSGKPTWTTTA